MEAIVDVEVRCEAAEMSAEEIEAFLRRVISQALSIEGWPEAEVSVVVTDDEEIKRMNGDFRGKDEATDVLSFPLNEWDRPGEMTGDDPTAEALGDVVISLERAREQAGSYGHSLERELGFLAVHGVLHLLGHDHDEEEERRRMREREEAILSAIGLFRE